jgi:hypothetical protein
MSGPTLHYDYIRPEALPINRFLFRFRGDPAFRRRVREDPAGMLAEHELSDEAGRAVLARDIAGLVAAGAHPLLAIFLRISADIDERPEAFEFY